MEFFKYFYTGPVVEIGSGDNPYPQSHILVDKYLDESELAGRNRKTKIDSRPLILADIENLPFIDQAFKYSICSHVLEHAVKIENAIAEIQRISCSGYIETPSALYEVIEPHRIYHNWLVRKKNNQLIIYKKDKSKLITHSLIYTLDKHNFSYKLFRISNQKLINTKLHWDHTINFKIENSKFNIEDYSGLCGQSFLNFIFFSFKELNQITKRKLSNYFVRFFKKYSINDLIRCPLCFKSLEIKKDKIICEQCNGYFPKKGNVYFLDTKYFISH